MTIFVLQLELGNQLYPCFSGPTKIPCTRINLRSGRGSFIEISTAEAGTIQLEFRDLARSAKQPKFEVSAGHLLLRDRGGGGGGREISTVEAGTIQLEFRDLARSAKQPKFEVSAGHLFLRDRDEGK